MLRTSPLRHLRALIVNSGVFKQLLFIFSFVIAVLLPCIGSPSQRITCANRVDTCELLVQIVWLHGCGTEARFLVADHLEESIPPIRGGSRSAISRHSVTCFCCLQHDTKVRCLFTLRVPSQMECSWQNSKYTSQTKGRLSTTQGSVIAEAHPYLRVYFKMAVYIQIVCFLLNVLSLVCSASAASICGTLGYHNETTLSFYMGNFFYSAPSIFTLCAALCKKDMRCRSFRYSGDANNQYCEYFNTTL